MNSHSFFLAAAAPFLTLLPASAQETRYEKVTARSG
jgi:hypothetical protein